MRNKYLRFADVLFLLSFVAGTTMTACSEQPYQPIGDAAQSRARALMHACRCVYAPLRTFGPMNEGNRLLIAEAAENGWLVSAISPKKPDAT